MPSAPRNSPVSAAALSTSGAHTIPPVSLPPSTAKSQPSSEPMFSKPRNTQVGTENTVPGEMSRICCPCSPILIRHRPLVQTKTSAVKCMCWLLTTP